MRDPQCQRIGVYPRHRYYWEGEYCSGAINVVNLQAQPRPEMDGIQAPRAPRYSKVLGFGVSLC
jgi:hypothetical protein